MAGVFPPQKTFFGYILLRRLDTPAPLSDSILIIITQLDRKKIV
jgi:hypothetical protein